MSDSTQKILVTNTLKDMYFIHVFNSSQILKLSAGIFELVSWTNRDTGGGSSFIQAHCLDLK